jgi:predicted RNase H-like nuclease
VRALGIDVGIGKGLDLVALDDRRVPERVLPRVPLRSLPGLIGELAPDVIAIDAPPGWATGGGSRLTERMLAEFNIHSFNTPSASNGKGHRFYEWMRVGFRVFRAAARAGFPRYAAGEPRGTAMEVFPHATATVLAGCLRPKGIAKKTWREGVLRAQGVRIDELTSADLVDAGLCALTGVLALQGKHFAPGDPKEGVIVLPVVTLPARPFLPSVAPQQAVGGSGSAAAAGGPIEASPRLFRYCGCGDPACHELTRAEFAPGHDAKRKSMLWRLARDGLDAATELRSRGWELPPEVR